MRYKDHEEWFFQFCEYLQKEINIKAVQELTPSTPFPCIHVEYEADENWFNRLTGNASLSLMVVFEAHAVPYMQKLQECLKKEVVLKKGGGLFKEVKIQKKSDKKIKTIVFDLKYFIKI